MKITNKTGLPEAFRRAVERDPYTRGASEYSVSDLVTPPRIVHLTRRHDGELEQDCVDRLWALFGQAAHHILECGAGEQVAELRLYANVDGVSVSGQVDLMDGGTITDYKTTSAWTIVYGDRLVEWTERMNCYAYLARANGYTVNGLQIVAILRDWSEAKALGCGNYPQAPVVQLDLDLWPEVAAEAYVRERVRQLAEAAELADDDLPECTAEDMWARPDTWSVMKHGRKSAVKVCQTEKEAIEYAGDDDRHYIEHRPGARVRCERYCPAAAVCNQYKKWKEQQDAVE